MSASPSILVCRLSALGDVVLALAVAQALREALPGCRLSFLSRAPHGRVLAGVPALDELHLWEGPPHGLPPGVLATRWDTVVDLSATGRSRRLLAGLDAMRILRPRKQSLRRFAFVKLRLWGGRRVRIIPAIDRLFSAVDPLGVSRDGRRPRFAVGPPPEGGPLLIAPGGGRDAKRWPVERFAEVARRVTGRGRRILLVGSQDEEGLLATVGHAVPASHGEICCGPDPSRLPEILSRCPVALTNDSGILHAAEASGVRVVAIFGPTHPRLGFAPLDPRSIALHSGLGCSPCDLHGPDRCPKRHHRCMGDLSVGDVMAELDARLPEELSSCA